MLLNPNWRHNEWPQITNRVIKRYKELSDIYIYCKSAKLPESSLEFISVPYFGRMYYEGADRTYNNLELTFYNSQDFAIRNFIEFWMDGINGYKSNAQKEESKAGDKDKYNLFIDGLQVNQLDRRNHIIKSYKFMGAFPVNCGEIGLDFGTTNSIEEFVVNFKYQWFETIEYTPDKSGGTNKSPSGGFTILTPHAPSQHYNVPFSNML